MVPGNPLSPPGSPEPRKEALMAPVYGSSRRAGVVGPWSMLRPGPRSALPRDLFWAPLSPLDNGALAALIARAVVR